MKAMNIVIISTIRNEADILEAFIRYHLRIADRMIIINHRSADASVDILKKLKQEGLPITIADVTNLEHQQGAVLTQFMKKAVHEHDADWVIPLDADEFIAMKDQGEIRDTITNLPHDKVTKISWRTYVPLPSDDTGELNILKRIQHCMQVEKTGLRKIIIPRYLAIKKNGWIAAGNHGFLKQTLFKKKQFSYEHVDQLVLAHFPVRSATQIIAKALVGWLACLSKPDKEPTEAYHLKMLYDRFRLDATIKPEELTLFAMEYAKNSLIVPINQGELKWRPLIPAPEAFSLRYTDTRKVEYLPLLAQTAEDLAEALGILRRENWKRDGLSGRMRAWLNFRRL